MVDRVEKRLLEGLKALSLSPDEFAIASLLHFLRLLEKWNAVYNLTAIRDLEQAVGLHVLDSLSILPYLQGRRILDVGTGAGLPGIPLALMAPEKNFYLLDSSAKKIRFVQQALLELALKNAQVIHARVEAFQSAQRFDTIIARAFASVPELWTKTHHLLVENGRLLAMKGRFPEEEIRSLTQGTCRVIPLKVPGLDAERHLVCLSKSTEVN